jgi:TPR repeat protein
MEEFDPHQGLAEQFHRFERAAAKGHEESSWILRVVRGVDIEESALIEAFAQTEEPLGWYFAGHLSVGRELFDFFKKSAEAGCGWGQVAYARCFWVREFVEWDEIVFMEWLEKSAKQNTPAAMEWLGDWQTERDCVEAVSYYRVSAELGWKDSMKCLATMLRYGDGCAKDLRQAAIWSATGNSFVFWDVLADAKRALKSGATGNLDCDFNHLCYSIGWGLYWYQYETEGWNNESDEDQVLGNGCLEFYCRCVELQQKSVVEFLLCWNRTTGGVKGPGQMIAQMVWEGREDNLLKEFEVKK